MAHVLTYISVISLFISVIFGIIALGAPNWSHIQRLGSGDGSRGLWMNCYSVDSTCYEKSLYPYQSDWYDYQKITAGFYLATVLCIIIAFVISLLDFCGVMNVIVVAGGFALFSAACSLVSLAVWAGMQTNKINSEQLVLSWGYILAVVQLITALFGGICCIISQRFKKEYY